MKKGLLERIQNLGHWRRNLRPLTPPAELMTLKECQDAVEKARISIRGWDYPHMTYREDDRSGTSRAGEYVEQWCDWDSKIEFWRMYRSGQFLSYSVLWEDASEGSLHAPTRRALDIRDAIYSITETTEFAKRLAVGGLYQDGLELIISLHESEGRALWVGPGRMPFFDIKTTEAEPIKIVFQVNRDDLVADPGAISLKILLELFDHFGWNPDPSQIQADQERFYNGNFN